MLPTDRKESLNAVHSAPHQNSKLELTPDPSKCSEKNCEETPLFAYLEKKIDRSQQQFKFCCNIHQGMIGAGGQVLECDNVENYLKKRKRNMYQKMLKEYL